MKTENKDNQGVMSYVKMTNKMKQMQKDKTGVHLHRPAGCRPRTGHSFAWCAPPLKTGRLQSELIKKGNKKYVKNI